MLNEEIEIVEILMLSSNTHYTGQQSDQHTVPAANLYFKPIISCTHVKI